MNQRASPSAGAGVRGALARLALLMIVLILLGFSLVTSVATGILVRLGPIRISSQSPVRSIVIGLIATVALYVVSRRQAVWRRLSIAFAATFVIVAFLAGHEDTAFSAGDGALIELYTIHAINGQQLLGAYSQYNWHHPGPLTFYWLAPFYLVGKLSTDALNTGVLVGNLVSLAILLWLVMKHAGRSAALPVTLAGLLAFYIVRTPLLLISGWNPHTPIVPLMALLAVASATLAGATALMPLALVLGSFIVQTHIGFGVVTVALCTMTVMTVLWRDWSHGGAAALRRRLVAGIFVLQALWLLPVAEEMVHSPGNLTQLLRFFTNGDPPQALGASWRAWATMLSGAFQPDFYLALGRRAPEPSTVWWPIVSSAVVVLLVPIAWLALGCGRRFLASLAAVCLVTSVAGLYSITQVRGLIFDYHIFWLSGLGVVNVAVVMASVVANWSDRLPASAAHFAARAAVTVVAAVAVLLPAWFLVSERSSRKEGRLGPESEQVRTLFAGISSSGSASLKTMVRLGDGMWGVGAGIVLQMVRAGLPVTVAPEMTWMFGDALATTGQEEQVLLILPTAEHLALPARPGYKTLAYSSGVFIDMINLREFPEYRR